MEGEGPSLLAVAAAPYSAAAAALSAFAIAADVGAVEEFLVLEQAQDVSHRTKWVAFAELEKWVEYLVLHLRFVRLEMSAVP